MSEVEKQLLELLKERSFRRVAYAIITVSALISLPLFDRLLR